MSDITDAAQELLMENIAAIPVKKSKAPDLLKGSVYFKQRIEEDKVTQVFNGAYGVGIKAGSLSEGIECIDFDDHDGKHGINEILRKFGRNEYIEHLKHEGKIYAQRTPSGGWHIVYRYIADKYEGNRVLARWKDGEVMIETRGEGGYFVAYPSPGYEKRYNELVKLKKIDKEERDDIIEIAKSLDQSKQKNDPDENDDLNTEPTDPISVFNIEKTAYAKKLLEDKGWVKVDKQEGIEKWRRPGKQEGISATWGWRYNALYVFSSNASPFKQGCYYTPFQIMVKLRFRNKYVDALDWAKNKTGFKQGENEAKYIRVGVDYYKVIKKIDRYGVSRKELKPWKKDEIKMDEGSKYPEQIPKYDDFTIEPNNFDHQTVINNYYNLYREFPFKPQKGSWYWTDVLLQHIFGEQYDIGLKYLQALYLYPKRILPILALVSQVRETGKTTFLNWLSMIWGDNMIIIGTEELNSQFNASYAAKNIIAIEETTVDKKVTTEKLKFLSTGKQISVNQKFVNSYKIPLYSKIILTSNDEDRFAQIDQEEVRYFVRKLGKPQIQNANIEEDLVKEIPAFLYYLTQMPDLDFSKSRMLFTAEELNNENLKIVKDESKSTLYKDLREYLTDLFHKKGVHELYAVPVDIKAKFFYNNSKIDVNYIRRVLKKEFNKKPEDVQRYTPLGDSPEDKTGRPFRFDRKDFIQDDSEPEQNQDNWEDENEPF